LQIFSLTLMLFQHVSPEQTVKYNQKLVETWCTINLKDLQTRSKNFDFAIRRGFTENFE
jgi:hypothetical protein